MRELCERLQVPQSCRTALGVAGAKRRRDELLEQRGLTIGRGAEGAQVPRRDAVARELRTRRGDVGVCLRIALVVARPRRREQPELLQLLREVGRDAGAVTELVEVDPVDVPGDPRRVPGVEV